MSKSVDTIFLPREDKLTITADAFAAGRIFSCDSSGQNTVYESAITASSVTVLGPNNTNKYYKIDLDKGSVTSVKEFAGAPAPDSGDVSGPASSTDNAIVRWDGTTGQTTQDSSIVISDADAVEGISSLDVDNLNLDGNTITSTDTNGNLNLTPNGTGDLVLDGLNWPQSDGTADQVLKTNGTGQLSFVDAASGGAGGAWTQVSSQVFTTSSTVDFDNTGITSTYDTYMFVLENIRFSTNATRIAIRTSEDNGETFAAGTGYATMNQAESLNQDAAIRNRATGTNAVVMGTSDVGPVPGVAGFVICHDPLISANVTYFYWSMLFPASNGRSDGVGRKNSAAAHNAIRFMPDIAYGGTMTGTIRLYGLNKS